MGQGSGDTGPFLGAQPPSSPLLGPAFKTIMITMEYYSAMKRTEVLVHAATRVDPGNVMLSERSQTQKATHCMVPFM